MTVGYSRTPLAKKLGLKAGQDAAFVALPAEVAELAIEIPFASIQQADSADGLRGPLDVVHAFYREAAAMDAGLNHLRAAIRPNGMIWISWPKKASKVATDLTEDVIRKAALAKGLVDIKVCAVSEVWSGLKLVIPVAQRDGLR